MGSDKKVSEHSGLGIFAAGSVGDVGLPSVVRIFHTEVDEPRAFSI